MGTIFIYGPPAVGKLTVAKALSEITGFKLVHNHLVADLVKSIFSHGSKAARKLHKSLRFAVYEAAAQSGINGLIFTFLYYGEEEDHKAVNDWENLSATYGNKVYFVRLYCEQEELEKRVLDPSRAGTKKVTDVEKLRTIIQKENVCGEIPQSIINGLSINNTSLNPSEVALTIRKHFQI